MFNRRAFLRGSGALLALPFLESLSRPLLGAPSVAASARPVRLAFLYFPNGCNMNQWSPAGEGSKFELSPTLQPLAPFQSDITVVKNLWNKHADTGDGHYVKTGGWLTSTTITKTTGAELNSGGVSVDQLAAQHLGSQTRLASLDLAVEPVSMGVDTNVGYTRLYGSHISWRDPRTPAARDINPRKAFDRLFRPSGRDPGDDRSVLDLVRGEATRLRREVSVRDREKLDEYLESVHSVERRISMEDKRLKDKDALDSNLVAAVKEYEARLDGFTPPADKKEKGKKWGFSANHQEHVDLMLDLQVLAFWSDSTRVSTFMFGNDVSGRDFSFVPGVHGAHHEISHHDKNEDKLAQYALINRWHVERYARFLGKLRDIKQEGRSLLDDSLILFGSSISDGNAHSPHNLPLVLAGHGGGAVAGGRHVVAPNDSPLSNLYLSLLKSVGVKADSFGDSTGELKGLRG